MKLFDLNASPNCRKVRVLARERGLALDLVAVDLTKPRDGAYLEKNPTGKVPTFVDDDGTTLWESGAILLHLAGDLLPSDAKARADVHRWMFFAATHIQPWMSVLGQERLLKPRRGETPDPHAIEYAERELARFMPVLEEALANTDYLAGPFTIADIMLGSGMEGVETRGVKLDAYPNIAAWRERLRARPSWKD